MERERRWHTWVQSWVGPFADTETTTPDSGRGRFQGQGLLGRAPEHPVPWGSVARGQSSSEILEITSPSPAGKPLDTGMNSLTAPSKGKTKTSPHHCPPGPQPTAPEGGGPWAGLGWAGSDACPFAWCKHLFLSTGQKPPLGRGIPQAGSPATPGRPQAPPP